jgi:transcriptional regulator with XRE-family HTH domain
MYQAAGRRAGHAGGVDRAELGLVLRAWRERLNPADVGLPAGTRRRTPGLRREEVAALAGVSVDHLTRIEQGRGAHPSESVLVALARALRLERAEREHLFRLAGTAPPGPGRIGRNVRPSVLRLMDRFTDLPALLLNARTDVLAWNQPASALLGDLSAVPEDRRNIWVRHFLDRADRVVEATEERRHRREAALVSDARAAFARYPEDTELAELVARLRRGSDRFAALWEERQVVPHLDDRKTFGHPEVGHITLDCLLLRIDEDDQNLLVYSAAPGSPDAEALALLRVLGTQDVGAARR